MRIILSGGFAELILILFYHVFFLRCQKKRLKSGIIGEILNSKDEFKITLSKTMNRQ